MALLEILNLKVQYGPILAVRGVSLNIKRGEIVALLGSNGAGKSSIMNAVAGLLPVSQGSVIYDGIDITDKPAEATPSLGLTLSPEGRRVFGTLTVEDNLTMGAYSVSHVGAIAQAKARVYELFPILAERRKQFAGTLSGGQQQMLAIGRALMCQPQLLLLDEPSLGLAPLVVEQMFELISSLRDQGVTIFIVEQNVAGTLNIADRAYMISSGQILKEGSADEMSRLASSDAFMGAH